MAEEEKLPEMLELEQNHKAKDSSNVEDVSDRIQRLNLFFEKENVSTKFVLQTYISINDMDTIEDR